MTEKNLITQIRQLRQIKPDKQWVFSVKNRILGEEAFNKGQISVFDILRSAFVRPKMALTFAVILGLFISSFGLAYNSLPGDLLYPVKRAMENSQTALASKENKPKAELKLANKRLEELKQIAEANQVPKLAPAIDEFQKSASEAARNLAEPEKVTKEMVQETKKLLENKETLETMGVVMNTEELDKTLLNLIQSQIEDLENRSLTDEQAETLESAKQALERGELNGALGKVLEVNSGSSENPEIKPEIKSDFSELNPTTEMTSTSEVISR